MSVLSVGRKRWPGVSLVLLAWVLLFCFNVSGASSTKGLKGPPLLPLPRVDGADGAGNLPWSERVVLVAVLDGTMHAIDTQSGDHLWSFASGSPLVSTGAHQVSGSSQERQKREDTNASIELGSEYEDEEEAEDELPVDGREVVFPGADGSLYAYQPGQGVQKLPVTAQELVAASPSVTRDGGLLLGSRHSAVFLLDSRTGRLLQRFGVGGEAPGGSADVAQEMVVRQASELWDPPAGDAPAGSSHADALLVLRTDYTVRSLEVGTGAERWNVSVGELGTLPNPLAPRGLVALRGYEGQLVAGADCSLRRVDPASGRDTWRTVFAAAPVAVYSISGALMQELLPGGHQDEVYLGHMGGQPYALPAGPQSGRGGPGKAGKTTRWDPPRLPAAAGAEPLPHQLVPVAEGSPVQAYAHLACAAPSGQLLPANEGAAGSLLLRLTDSLPPLPGSPTWEALAPTHAPAPPPLPPPAPPRASIWLGILLGVSGAVLAAAVGTWLRGGWGVRWSTTPHGQRQQGGTPAKRRKARKGSSAGGLGQAALGEGGERGAPDSGASSAEPRLPGPAEGVEEGRWVGRLLVGSRIIGYGSHGTLVLEGQLEGRPVAVKRLLSQFYEKARKEIAALIASDEHPNVVRCFAMEEDAAFVYVALERCCLSLSDLVGACSATADVGEPLEESRVEAARQVAARLGCSRLELLLWDAHGRPSAWLLQIMRDVVAGLAHVHELGIVHRDLKPQNVLVSTARGAAGGTTLRAKLSDMGISKRLLEGDSSFDPHATGHGSAGWQAPEQLQHGRQTRAVDMFALGCVLFFCVSGGRHPFGARFERDANIVRGLCDLFPVEHLPEAQHLLGALLSPTPALRLTAAEVQQHPLLWGPEQRLAFLRDASDRVEGEDREEGSELLAAMEAAGPSALGGTWNDKLDPALLDNLGRYRRYNFRSVRDLLRVIRNKCHHYRELPQPLQELLGPVPEGYERYFQTRFPRLLIEVYCVLQQHCRHDHIFRRYFSHSGHGNGDTHF